MSGHSSGDRPNATNSPEFGEFTDFMRKLAAVPHSELKQRLESEKEAKRKAKLYSSDRVSHDKD
jgi:hypothetical protein